jgi:hypothetical protein
VLWCTGFGPDTGWLQVPVLLPDGTPAHTRGITAFPGLYVAGYPWLSSRGSGLLYGVAADSARIAQHVAAGRAAWDGPAGYPADGIARSAGRIGAPALDNSNRQPAASGAASSQEGAPA